MELSDRNNYGNHTFAKRQRQGEQAYSRERSSSWLMKDETVPLSRLCATENHVNFRSMLSAVGILPLNRLFGKSLQKRYRCLDDERHSAAGLTSSRAATAG